MSEDENKDEPQRNNKGQFVEGNEIWALRGDNHGGQTSKWTAELIKEAFEGYKKQNASDYQKLCGAVKKDDDGNLSEPNFVPKEKPLTLVGLRLYMGIGSSTWSDWRRDRTDLAEIIEECEAACFKHCFDGAVTGAFKENIIARHLGLADKSETKHNIDPLKAILDEIREEDAKSRE